MDSNVPRDLARDLGRARGPDRRLDLRIHAAARPESLAYETASCIAGDPALTDTCVALICRELQVPAYTASAAETIPGERILCAGPAPDGVLWAAVQGWGLAPGAPHHRMGWGATEALARRAAALEALADGCAEFGGIHAGAPVMAPAGADEAPPPDAENVAPGGDAPPKWSFEF